jgi:hypothetical protein
VQRGRFLVRRREDFRPITPVSERKEKCIVAKTQQERVPVESIGRRLAAGPENAIAVNIRKRL